MQKDFSQKVNLFDVRGQPLLLNGVHCTTRAGTYFSTKVKISLNKCKDISQQMLKIFLKRCKTFLLKCMNLFHVRGRPLLLNGIHCTTRAGAYC